MYRGLTAASDTGDINLDAVRHDLDKARGERANPSTKNVHYSQQLRRYLQMRKENADRPTKVELTKGISVLLKRGGEDGDGEVVGTPPAPPPPPSPPPPDKHTRRHPNPQDNSPSPHDNGPPPRPPRPPRPRKTTSSRRRIGRLQQRRQTRHDVQRPPLPQDVAAAAAAPLPESDEDDDYMLESGYRLPAPSQYYGDLPVLPDNANEIEEMDTVQQIAKEN
uniref:Uncharacterized protein n=1 Tax=Globodera rostochiensis TaxID=31243 RepID=A0A914H7A8_GLORO